MRGHPKVPSFYFVSCQQFIRQSHPHPRIVFLSLLHLAKTLYELKIGVGPIVDRGHTEEALEEPAEIALIRKTKLIANLLYVAGRIAQKEQGLHSQGSIDGTLGRQSGVGPDDLGEVLTGDAELLSIEGDVVVLSEIIVQKHSELCRNILTIDRDLLFFLIQVSDVLIEGQEEDIEEGIGNISRIHIDGLATKLPKHDTEGIDSFLAMVAHLPHQPLEDIGKKGVSQLLQYDLLECHHESHDLCLHIVACLDDIDTGMRRQKDKVLRREGELPAIDLHSHRASLDVDEQDALQHIRLLVKIHTFDYLIEVQGHPGRKLGYVVSSCLHIINSSFRVSPVNTCSPQRSLQK